MTNEEKAKAYDKAIERINECSTDKYGYLLSIKPSDIFPQFFEREDERIRKRLIDCLKFSLKGAEEQDAAGCSRQKDIEAYKWGIAYLEKQKEQKPLSTEETEQNSIAFLEQLGYTCVPPGADAILTGCYQ